MKDRDRTPVRKGRIYCSPACGCGCTWAEYQQAVKQADELCKEMGRGWQPRVWENGRWHYSVVKGVCHIHPNYLWSSGGEREFVNYMVFFNTNPQAIGIHNTDPHAALKHALDVARERIKKASFDIAVVLA